MSDNEDKNTPVNSQKLPINFSNKKEPHINGEPLSQKSNGRKKKEAPKSDKKKEKSEKKQRKSNVEEEKESQEVVGKQNRDHCNLCKDGGELICCDHCPRSFHVKCLGVKEEDLPEGDWYCQRCIPIIEKRKQQDEEKRKKHEEREKQLLEKKYQKEQQLKEKEQEAEKKREQKRLEKEKLEEEKQRIKEQKLEELRNKMQRQKELSTTGGVGSQQSVNPSDFNKEGSSALNKSPISPSKRVKQDSTGVESPMANDLQPTNTNNEKSKVQKKKPVVQESKNGQTGNAMSSNQKKAEDKSDADKAKEAKAKEIRTQFKMFARVYPELVDKHSIKYPIEDMLIKKMPLLHGAENLPQKPEPKKILIEGRNFETLVYVWEFFNNFSDLLNIQNFKIEELQAALDFTQKPDQLQVYSQQDEDDWEKQISTKTLQEQGFGLIQTLHTAAINIFIKELTNIEEKNKNSAGEGNKEKDDEDGDALLLSIKKYIEKKDYLWPELVRLILKSQKQFDFHPLDKHMNDVCEKLSNCVPETYSHQLTYNDKLSILELLVDGVHGLDEFRQFLNQRLEEKSSYNKQKIDIYAEIKQLENQKQELIKEHAQNNFFNNSEQILNQIEDLKKQLSTANRIESRRITQQINELQYEKNKILKEMQKIEDQIEKRQSKIERLNESAHKTSIKTQMLGKDAERNEFWFFKEDPGKLFFKKVIIPELPQAHEQEEKMIVDDENDLQVPPEPIVIWSFFDEEEEFEKILESCNIKGIRERKLQENLRKIRDRLKLKKSRRSAAVAQQATNNVSQDNKVEENKEQDEEPMEELSQNNKDNNVKHILFENDDYYTALTNAIWYGKKMPTKRQLMLENKAMATRKQIGNQREMKQKTQEEVKISLDSIRQMMLNVEELYTDSSLQFQREWDYKHIRDRTREFILNAKSVQEFAKELLKLDQGFCHPHQLRYKKAQDEDSQSDGGDNQQQNEDQLMDGQGDQNDKNVKVFKLQWFKFWPSKDLRNAWRQYVFQDCVDNNVNALYIAVKLFEIITGECVQRQLDKSFKKKQKDQPKQGGSSKYDGQAQAASRGGRKEKSYKQYFESSDEEESNEKSRKSARIQGGRQKKRKGDSDSEIDYDNQSEEEEEEVDEENQGKEWDEKCYACGKGGNVLCCESCTHVAHLQCAGLKKEPQGDWNCEECLIRFTQRRTTRGQVTHQWKKNNGGQSRYERSHMRNK